MTTSTKYYHFDAVGGTLASTATSVAQGTTTLDFDLFPGLPGGVDAVEDTLGNQGLLAGHR